MLGWVPPEAHCWDKDLSAPGGNISGNAGREPTQSASRLAASGRCCTAHLRAVPAKGQKLINNQTSCVPG